VVTEGSQTAVVLARDAKIVEYRVLGQSGAEKGKQIQVQTKAKTKENKSRQAMQ
jgi:hypothetical protein